MGTGACFFCHLLALSPGLRVQTHLLQCWEQHRAAVPEEGARPSGDMAWPSCFGSGRGPARLPIDPGSVFLPRVRRLEDEMAASPQRNVV